MLPHQRRGGHIVFGGNLIGVNFDALTGLEFNLRVHTKKIFLSYVCGYSKEPSQ